MDDYKRGRSDRTTPPQSFEAIKVDRETDREELFRVRQQIFKLQHEIHILNSGEHVPGLDQRYSVEQHVSARRDLLGRLQCRAKVLTCSHGDFEWSCKSCEVTEEAHGSGSGLTHTSLMRCRDCSLAHIIRCPATYPYPYQQQIKDHELHAECAKGSIGQGKKVTDLIVQGWRMQDGVPVPIRLCVKCRLGLQKFWGYRGVEHTPLQIERKSAQRLYPELFPWLLSVQLI